MANRVLNDRFELLRPLSTDALGSTFYAWDHDQRRAVSVLELTAFPTWPPAVARQFLSDIIAHLNLHHPNVESLLFAGQSAQGRVYVVHGFLDGVPLHLVLQRLTAQDQVQRNAIATSGWCMAP